MRRNRTSLHAAAVRFPLVGGLAKVLLLTSAILHPGFALADVPGPVTPVGAGTAPTALHDRQEGGSERALTAATDERARDVSVVGSARPHVFDHEAVRALQPSTFEPAR
jgi:hypothetical protein